MDDVEIELRNMLARTRASNAELLAALEAWRAFDNDPFHFDDRRYIELAERARALTDAAIERAKNG